MKFKLLVLSFLFSATLGWGQASLPLTRTAWDVTPTGWTDTPLDNYLTIFACSGSNGAKFDTTGDLKIVNFNASPNQLTFVVKSNAATTSSLLVEESADGVAYSTVVNLSGSTDLPTTCATRGPYTLNAASRFVRWRFTKGTSNMTMDDVSITASAGCTAAAITGQPSTTVQNLCQSAAATALSVTATGTTLTYQWYSNAANSNVGGTLIAGATSASYTPSTAVAGTLYYYCVVTAACGAPVTSNVSGGVTVNPLPAAPPAPTAVANPSCGATTLNVMVPPAGETYYWQGTTSNGTSTASSTAFTYNVASSGTYYVRSRNNTTLCWSAQSSIVMTVNTPVSISVHPVNQTANVPSTRNFTVTAAGTGLTYQWQFSTDGGTVWNNVSSGTGGTTNSYTTPATTLAMDGYQYRCIVSGTAPCTSVTSNNATLTVNNTAPNNPTNVTACYGNTSVALSWTAATGSPDGYMVFALAGATAPAATAAVAGNASLYTANSDYSLASVVTASLGKCVYKGVGLTATITGLTNASNYSFKVVAYTGNTQTGWSPGINTDGSWNLPVTNVTADVPEVSALAASVASGQSALTWTRPTPIACNEYLIVANQGAVVFTPAGDGSAYTANTVYSGANQVVYKGNGTGVTVTGLTNGLSYCYKVFVRDINTNNWSDGVSVCQTPLPVIPDNGCATSNYLEYTINQAASLTISDVNLGVKINHPFRGDLNITLISPLGTTVSLVNSVGGGADNFDAIIDDQGTTNAFSTGNHTVDATYDVTGKPQGTGVGALSAFNGENAQGIWKIRVCDNAAADVGTFVSGELFFTSCPAATISSVTPTSGPVGTEVTINASVGDLSGATVKFNGVTATIVSNTSSQLVVLVPTGATSGNIVITAPAICNTSTPFTVINNNTISCEGGILPADLFFSEVTDSNSGSLSYVEIYNGTGATVNLSGYSVRTANNGGAYTSTVNLNAVNLVNGGVYVLALGDDDSCASAGGDGSLAAQSSAGGSVNFSVGGNDHIGLFNGASIIDSWGVQGNANWAPAGIGTEGVSFRRKITVTAPSVTYNNNDWDIIDYAGNTPADCANNDYSDIGIYNKPIANPANIGVQPSYVPTCADSAVLSVAATEGFPGGNPLTYQWYYVAPGDTSWTAVVNGGVYSGATTNTLMISSTSGLVNYQYYCQVREDSVTCFVATRAIKITPSSSTTWNGTAWSNGVPDLTKLAIINGNYNTAANGNIDACSLIVNVGFTATVTANQYINIQNDLTVNGTLDVLDQGSLVMISNTGIVTNNGTTNVRKMSTLFDKYDYTFWSSPVANATIGVFSQWQTNYIFKLNTAAFRDDNNDSHDDNMDAWVFTPQTEVMSPGRGYAAMGKIAQTFPAQQASVYSGAVNNGIITQPIALSLDNTKANDDFNLIGNPYPSAISADAFITANPDISGTLYFWTHEGNIQVAAINPGPMAMNFSPDDFAYYNLAGGTGTRAGLLSGNGNSNAPSGFIASGQGFQVDADAATSVTFNNSMRNKTHINTDFYRNPAAGPAPQKDRIWLNLTNPEGIFSQQLVGFFPEATMGVDRGYDGYYTKSPTYAAFYSMIGNTPYKIQGRSTFDVNDRIPLGFRSAYEKTYAISIGDIEGVLRNQNVYIEDLQLNVIHDLKASNYVFSTPAGEFNNRFVLRFTNTTLGNEDFEAASNAVMIYANDNINVTSSLERIKDVMVYDVLGRLITEKKNVSGNAAVLTNVRPTQSALIVKVTLENGQTVTKKVIY